MIVDKIALILGITIFLCGTLYCGVRLLLCILKNYLIKELEDKLENTLLSLRVSERQEEFYRDSYNQCLQNNLRLQNHINSLKESMQTEQSSAHKSCHLEE